MWQLWMSCHEHEEIATLVGVDRTVVTKFLQEKCKSFQGKDLHISSNFEPELYTVWNFAKSTNEVKHFGNIPPRSAVDSLHNKWELAALAGCATDHDRPRSRCGPGADLPSPRHDTIAPGCLRLQPCRSARPAFVEHRD